MSSERNDRPRTSMGVNMDGSAWVRHGETVYCVERQREQAEYGPDDYAVVVERGPDVLDHAYVRECAHDAFIDAYGAV